jgi:exodeoxyribonuclease V alpha subunit
VLGDICGGERVERCSIRTARSIGELSGDDLGPFAEESEGLLDSIVLLQKNYRFGTASGIGRVSRLVNEGHGNEALGLVQDSGAHDVGWVEVPTPARVAMALRNPVIDGYRDVVTARDPEAAHAAFERFQILCAVRRSPYGVEEVNRLAESILAGEGLIEPGGRWYAGRPVMVTRTDYHLELCKGDVGITLPDENADEQLMVFFPSPDGSMRRIAPTRVPEHETAYAMTVHKSQGSEFDEALLLLGAQPSRVLTRELVYTGLTRARSRVAVWGTPEVFSAAVAARSRRSSGLRDALWNVERG